MMDGDEVLIFYRLDLDLVVLVRRFGLQSRKRHTAAADDRISQGVDHVAADGADVQLGAKQIGGSVLIDDRMSIVGSYNMDMRSTYQDTELMLAVDCPELNSIIKDEMKRDKTYSKTMGSDGEYDYGENYHSKDLSFGKQVFYAVLRVITIPLRRFL